MTLFFLFSAQQSRISSDFEIQQMERQLATTHDFVSQLSAHLNLGDLRAARSETARANAEYKSALEIATRERLDARRASDMARYATATSYAALAEAKLGVDDARAFALAEEALRYTSDSAKTWNLYASTMAQLRKTAKAASAARNAVAIAETEGDRLDLAVYQYSLATFTNDEPLLRTVIASLKSSAFDPLKSAVVRNESFEIYSSARGDVATYVSLLNRAQLRLAGLVERRGDVVEARRLYEAVLASRSDDPTALAAIARLGPDEKAFAAAFDANPFSIALIRDYQRYLRVIPSAARNPLIAGDSQTPGAEVRRALQQIHAGELRGARATLDALLARFPDNDTLRTLRREAEEPESGAPAFLAGGKATAQPSGPELRKLLGLKLTPEQRATLDQMTFSGVVIFAQTPFASGTIEGVPFRFAEPTVFNGSFAASTPLRLVYRILGVTDVGGADGLLLEPIRIEAVK
jgi:tetratricopeptide (TPR) repeat protein